METRYGALYQNSYIDPAEIEDYKTHLLGLEWLTKRTARHEYFMSDVDLSYSYGGTSENSPVYTSSPVTPEISKILFLA